MASGLSETAKLVSSLELKDNFTPAANKAIKSLGRMESTGFRVGQQIGKGVNNAAKNIKRIAEVAVVGLAGAVALGVRSLGDLARSNAQTAAVIESTGGKANVSAAQVREYAENLENLTTVDDKVIQDGENMLLTFTNIGSTVFPEAARAATNMAVAMAGGNVEAVDLKSSAIQLGKALNDPVKGIGALAKVGVSFTDVQKKTIAQNAVLSKEETKHYIQLRKTNKAAAERYKAGVLNNKLIASQKIILAELNTEFGKAGEAAGKGPEAVMRRLADAGEGVSQILARGVLPVLERFATFLTTKLNDKGFLDNVDAFGRKLGEAGGKFLDFIEKVDFGAIGRALQTGAQFAGEIINAFLKAPAWLQTAIVTGWGLNKLTGGAVTGIFGELASGLIKGVLGINAGIVNVNGPVAGAGAGAGVGAGASVASLIPFAGLVAVGSAAGEGAAREINKNKGTDFHMPAGFLDIPTQVSNLVQAVGVLTGGKPNNKQFNRIEETTQAVDEMKGKVSDDLDITKAALAAAAGKTTTATSAGAQRVTSATYAAASIVAGAVRSSQPIVNTYVNVSSTTVDKTTTVIKRYGSIGGDRVQGGSGVTHNGAD